MRVTIKEHHKGKCGTCKHAVIVRGSNGETVLKCQMISFESYLREDRIPFNVTECTSYSKIGVMDLAAMSSVAWILEVDKRKGTAGFISSEEWDKKHPKQNVIPKGVDWDY